MSDMQIDPKQFYNEFGLKLCNHIYKKQDYTFGQKIMIQLRKHYVAHRDFYKKFLAESTMEKIMLKEKREHKLSLNSCAAEMQNNKGESSLPYYYLESIQIIDILPKEFIPFFINQIKKTIKRNSDNGKGTFKYIHDMQYEDYCKTQDLYFFTPVASYFVKSDSKLGQYVNGVKIDMTALSSSFVGIVFSLFINDDWKNKISVLCVNDREDHLFYSGMDNLKIYQFRKIGIGYNPGNVYKRELVGALLEEIKYRLSNELLKGLNTVIYTMNQESIAINVFQTNIEGNTSKEFWESIGVDNRFCNLINGQDACISYFNTHNNDLNYIYKNNKFDKYDSHIVADEIGNRFVEYLSVVGLKNAVEDEVTQISIWIQKCMNANLDVWLQLKAKVDNELIYAKRFVNEFKSKNYIEAEDFISLSNYNIGEDAIEYLDSTVENCKDLIEDTQNIVDSNLEARNSTLSYRIQKNTLHINLFSAIAALVAILISLFSLMSDDKKKIIVNYLYNVSAFEYLMKIIMWIRTQSIIRYVFLIILSLVLIIYLMKILARIYTKLKYFIMFSDKL